MIRINLLPVREARRRADLNQQFLLLGILVVGTLLGVGWFHLSLGGKVGDAKRRVAGLQKQIKKFKPQQEQVERYKRKKQKVQRKLDVITSLDRSRSGPVRVLDELATRTPDRMWLRRVQTRKDRIDINGLSLDNEVVALFLTELEDSPYFKRVELKKTELAPAKGGLNLHSFSVKALVTDPERERLEAEKRKRKKDKKGKKGKRGRKGKRQKRADVELGLEGTVSAEAALVTLEESR